MGDQRQDRSAYAAEAQQAAAQVGAIDKINSMSAIARDLLGGNLGLFGKTNFENHDLNDMIDMVEAAAPELLESAAKAMWDAQEAVHAAAEELKGHIGRVDWHGESGDSFRKWGTKLVHHTYALADFAEVVGTQMQAAATGLASVRNSMPPRDNRPEPKKVTDIPEAKRVASNEEYAAALKAEKDRQEAINQMNRLASVYAVSEKVLATQEPPTFEPMPNVGVPKPNKRDGGGGGGEAAPKTDGRLSHSVGAPSELAVHHPVVPGAERSDPYTSLPNLQGTDVSAVHHKVEAPAVSTEIDSVGVLPPQETAQQIPTVPPTTTTTGGGTAGTVPPLPTAAMPAAVRGPFGRTPGMGRPSGGARAPFAPQNPGGMSGGPAFGRTTQAIGRAAPTGQAGVAPGRSSTTAGKAPLARGVTGGTEKPVGVTGGRTGAASIGRAGKTGAPARGSDTAVAGSGAQRTGGVVGGKPVTGPNPATSGSRVPRSPAIGAGNASGARPQGERPGQRGVIGVSEPATRQGRPRTTRPTASTPDGVVGGPRSGARAGRPEADRGRETQAREPQDNAGRAAVTD